ncbi:hypothetical protein [Flagellimonas sp.]|uniref:hypothetical protein n=1 Tax=Flagellimonas sp. TaxID=2058762 RepID=UPI003B522152
MEFVFLWMHEIQTINQTQKKQLSHFIKEGYGSPQEFAKVLDRNLEMLFYIEEEVFTPREVQSVVSALRGIVTILRLRERKKSK